MGKRDPAGPLPRVVLVLAVSPMELELQLVMHAAWQEGNAIAVPLSRSDHDLVRTEINVLDAQPAAFQEP